VERRSRKDQWVGNRAVNAQDMRESDGMTDVRARVSVFAPLHAALLSGELNGSDHQADVVGRLHVNTLTLGDSR
jgi:hypothetical protein